MRLRPTACGSTLRDTARPRRGSSSPDCQCKASTGSATRRPCWKMRSKSERARTRAVRGNRGDVMGRCRLKPDGRAEPRPERLGAETLAALGATTGKNLAAVGGSHAGTEAVVALALEVAGLIGALGGHGGLAGSDRKDSEVYRRAGNRSSRRARARPLGA